MFCMAMIRDAVMVGRFCYFAGFRFRREKRLPLMFLGPMNRVQQVPAVIRRSGVLRLR